MTWFLQGVQLPIPPAKFAKKTIRQAKIVSVIDDFPNPGQNQPTRFELNLEGLIWPRSLARALDEATKNAETTDFLVFTDDADNDDPWITGMYAVTKSEVKIDKPMFTGTGQEVFKYKISFSKYADLDSVDTADKGNGEQEGTDF